MDQVFFIVELERHDGYTTSFDQRRHGPFDTKQEAYDFCADFNSSVYSCKIVPVTKITKIDPVEEVMPYVGP